MKNSPVSTNEAVVDAALKLLAYCKANDWAGYDPYDALNSRVFRAMPLLHFKTARQILTQAVKRSPINLRPLLLIPKTPNSKGIALFLSAVVRLSRIGAVGDDKEMRALADTLLSLRSPHQRYSCWGYNFDWQTRNELVPRGSPNIICSTFAGNALLDIYEQTRESLWLEAAVSVAEFILDVLYWRDGSSIACFSYTPLRRSEIHNANLLGAAYLGRVGRISGEKKFLQPALAAARYSARKQHADGSWPYGEGAHQEWIDNFHTGFNLVALKRLEEYGRIEEFAPVIRRGFDFYRRFFFTEGGVAKYYHDSTYPIDIHSIAQGLITLTELQSLSEDSDDVACAVLCWTFQNMWDDRGFFYFQKHAHFTVRTSFMRWSQAWMLLALSSLLGRT